MNTADFTPEDLSATCTLGRKVSARGFPKISRRKSASTSWRAPNCLMLGKDPFSVPTWRGRREQDRAGLSRGRSRVHRPGVSGAVHSPLSWPRGGVSPHSASQLRCRDFGRLAQGITGCSAARLGPSLWFHVAHLEGSSCASGRVWGAQGLEGASGTATQLRPLTEEGTESRQAHLPPGEPDRMGPPRPPPRAAGATLPPVR